MQVEQDAVPVSETMEPVILTTALPLESNI